MEKEEVEFVPQRLEDVLESIAESIAIEEPEEETVELAVSNSYSAYSSMYEGTPSEIIMESRKYMFQQFDQMALKARRLTPEDDYVKDRYKFMLTEGQFFTIGMAY